MHRKHLVNVSKMQISMESVSAVGPQTRVSEAGPPEVILGMQGRVTKGGSDTTSVGAGLEHCAHSLSSCLLWGQFVRKKKCWAGTQETWVLILP